MATPEKQPHYNNEVASQMIWEFLSTLFTICWSKNHEKIEIRRFGTPAEECLKKFQVYQKKVLEVLWSLLLYCGTAFLTYWFWGTRTPWIAGAALIGALFFFIRIIVGFREAQRIRPGKTIMEVAEQWSKTKKLITKSDFLHGLEAALKYSAGKMVNIIPENMDWMACFRDTVCRRLTKLGAELGEAEAEQNEPARAKIRAQYEKLFSLAQFFEAVGVNVRFGHFLPPKSSK